MSVKKLIFKSIGTHLMQKLNIATNAEFPNDLPHLQWYDKQMNQFVDQETSFALPLPAVLIEFGQFTWTTTGKGVQKGEGVLRFYTYFENYANSFNGSLNQELALQFWRFTEEVNKYLQGLAIEGILSPLDRVTDAEDIEQDMIITSITEYSTTIFDSSTNETRNYIEVNPDMNVERKKQITRPPVDNDPPFIT